MINLFDLDPSGLAAFFIEHGEKRFRAQQVLKWIYHEGQLDIEQWTNLSKNCRAFLQAETRLTLPKIITAQHSADGTIKWMLQLPDTNGMTVVRYVSRHRRGVHWLVRFVLRHTKVLIAI